jgi:hypothetical protein
MLQMRMKGSTGQFYNPQRDLVYIWPRAIRAALKAFDNFEGDEHCTKDELCNAAGEMARTFSAIVKDPTMPEQASKMMLDMDAKYPNAMPKIHSALFHAVVGVWTGWTMDVRPKTADDASIPTLGLDDIAEMMSRRVTENNETKRNA